MKINTYRQMTRGYIEYDSDIASTIHRTELEVLDGRQYTIFCQCDECGNKEVFINVTASSA